MYKKIISLFLLWRILLLIPLLISSSIVIRTGYDYTTLLKFISSSSPLSNFFLYPWANFDGIYYLYIAGSGYTVDNAGFFPLYPMLIKMFGLNSASFSVPQFMTGLLLSSLFFLLGLIFMHKLLKFDYKNGIVMLAIIAVLVFPTSFFFAAIYSESLFFLLLVLSFYFARKGNWFFSSFFAAALTATRVVGVAIIPALIFEFYIQNKTLFSRRIFPLLLAPLGILTYSLFNFLQWGTPLQFLKAQSALQNNRSVDQIVLFPQTIFRYIKILFTSAQTYEWWIAALELSSFVFAGVLLYIAWKKRVRTSYILFSIIALLIPASTGTFSGLPRYVLILFPIFIGLALIENKFFKFIYFIISGVLLFLLFALFSKGYFIA